ncbi:MAG: hypothetical protein M1825_003298 [Sarcosagium campestre]|nr:MAG: hypothetical protein M1825_003298 [Sarcosagium campestre]
MAQFQNDARESTDMPTGGDSRPPVRNAANCSCKCTGCCCNDVSQDDGADAGKESPEPRYMAGFIDEVVSDYEDTQGQEGADGLPSTFCSAWNQSMDQVVDSDVLQLSAMDHDQPVIPVTEDWLLDMHFPEWMGLRSMTPRIHLPKTPSSMGGQSPSDSIMLMGDPSIRASSEELTGYGTYHFTGNDENFLDVGAWASGSYVYNPLPLTASPAQGPPSRR